MYYNGGVCWCASRYLQAPIEIEAPSLLAAAVAAVLFNIIYLLYYILYFVAVVGIIINMVM